MKKLLAFAAAALVSGGVMAQCTPVDPVVAEGQVYQLKMSLKTTQGSVINGTTGGSICTPGQASCTVIRCTDKIAVAGWIYSCDYLCDALKQGTVVAWDTKRKVQIADATMDWTILNVIGKKQNQAEGMFTFAGMATYAGFGDQTYALTGAGFGKYDAKKGYYTALNGNVAGSMTASYALKTKVQADCSCSPSQVWDCNDLTTLTDADTVAFGTWSVKFNSSASKKYAQGYLKVPAYVTL